MATRIKTVTLRFYKERLLRVLVAIQEGLDDSLRLEDLARLAGLAPHHFHHVFTGMLGESLQAHIRRLRLERAAVRLKLGPQPIIQIAFDAGYQTHEAFTRAFHTHFGCSPIVFRRRHGAIAKLAAASGVHYHHPAGLRNFRTTPLPHKPMKVSIKKLEPVRVAFLRHLGPYDEVGQTWDRLTLNLGKEGWLGGDAQFIGICHDDPAVTPAHQIRYDACVRVDASFKPWDDIGVQIIPGGEYAVLTHFGSYDQLGDSYDQLLGQWLPRSHRALRSSPCFEIYLNSPENTEPADLVTDLHVPLEPQ